MEEKDKKGKLYRWSILTKEASLAHLYYLYIHGVLFAMCLFL